MILHPKHTQFGAWYNPTTWFEDSEQEKALQKAELQKTKASTIVMYAGAAAVVLLAASFLMKARK